MINKYNIEVKLVSGTDYCVELAPIEIMAEHKTDVYEKIKQGFEAVERMKPKKPIDVSMVRDCEGYIGLIGKCPCCEDIVEEDTVYCDCGQKLDWQ